MLIELPSLAVWCVTTTDPQGGESTHVFSTEASARLWVKKWPDRGHVIYVQYVDEPERAI